MPRTEIKERCDSNIMMTMRFSISIIGKTQFNMQNNNETKLLMQ